jgi:hypothetical protein
MQIGTLLTGGICSESVRADSHDRWRRVRKMQQADSTARNRNPELETPKSDSVPPIVHDVRAIGPAARRFTRASWSRASATT